jgi:hypothetical protein
MGPVALRFLTEDAQHFRLRGRQLDVITDAEEHGFRCAALLDDKGPALIGNAVQELAEIRARIQRGNYDAAGLIRRVPINSPLHYSEQSMKFMRQAAGWEDQDRRK